VRQHTATARQSRCWPPQQHWGCSPLTNGEKRGRVLVLTAKLSDELGASQRGLANGRKGTGPLRSVGSPGGGGSPDQGRQKAMIFLYTRTAAAQCGWAQLPFIGVDLVSPLARRARQGPSRCNSTVYVDLHRPTPAASPAMWAQVEWETALGGHQTASSSSALQGSPEPDTRLARIDGSANSRSTLGVFCTSELILKSYCDNQDKLWAATYAVGLQP
jgi:hypothetical protein